MAIQQPAGASSPVGAEDGSQESLSGFERASQEIERASQKRSSPAERPVLSELPRLSVNKAGMCPQRTKCASLGTMTVCLASTALHQNMLQA